MTARVESATAFLATRGLDLAKVGEIVRRAMGEVDVVLLTSSPVHGLANATSDLDTVCVSPGAAASLMATQMFAEGNHLEAVLFGTDHLDADLADLERVAALPLPEVVDAVRAWDKAHTVRRKYLERAVNGVSVDGTLPYADRLPALARAWTASSLDTAARAIAFASLAQRAGERRGTCGYAHTGFLHLADVVLSNHGDVFSNRKWYLLRWQRFLAGAGPSIEWKPAVDAVEQCRADVVAALRGDALVDVVGSLVEALAAVGDALDRQPSPPRFRVADGVQRMPFLPGAEMALVGSRAIVVDGGLDGVDVDDDPSTFDADLARRCLHAARVGAVEVSVW